MADAPSVSLIIASRHRPAMLARCLTAVAQLDHPAFEVVVVADPVGLEVARAWPVKAVPFNERNISVARNLGIAAAAGDVVAFIDDDAVPEPLWLAHLTQPFADPQVVASGGFVVGWNGISFEWKSGAVDRHLALHRLPVPEDRVSLHRLQPGIAVDIKGVNCAYRRAMLVEMGGFDPLLRYYLDETELNLRLAQRPGLTAVVPMARVHHRKAASDQRRADRAPASLYDIGFSSSVTLRRHGAEPAEQQAAQMQIAANERQKLLRMMVSGVIGTDDVGRLLSSLDLGFAAGLAVSLPPLSSISGQAEGFVAFPAVRRDLVQIKGWVWRAQSLRAKARALVAEGRIVRLYLFSPTALFHKHIFSDGYWCQHGGLFGKSDRSDAVFRLWWFGKRFDRESARFLTGFRDS